MPTPSTEAETPSEPESAPTPDPSPEPEPEQITLRLDAKEQASVPVPHFNFKKTDATDHAIVGRGKSVAMQDSHGEEESVAKTDEKETESTSVKLDSGLQPFHPAWEVDRLRWPGICDALLDEHAETMGCIAERVIETADKGHRIIGVVGARPGSGCTTIALCVSRLVAKKN